MKRSPLPLAALGLGLVALALWLFGSKGPNDTVRVASGGAVLESNSSAPKLAEPKTQSEASDREAVTESHAPEAAPLPTATLCPLFMSAPDKVEPYVDALFFTSLTEDTQVKATADATGHLQVPAGTWRIETDGETMHVDPEVVAIAEGETRTLFISPRRTLKLRVITAAGVPIEGAMAQWTGRGTPTRLIPGAPITRKRIGHSGKNGWITFDDDSPVSELCGELKVIASGFQPGIFLIDSSRLEEDPTCVLSPSPDGTASPGTLTFVARETGEPVRGVRLITYIGELPDASDAMGRFKLPSWLEAKNLIEMKHDTFGANDLTVSDALRNNGRVELSREVMVTIDPGTEGPGTLIVLEPPASTTERPKGPRRPALVEPTPFAAGSTSSVKLPIGKSVLALAVQENGTVYRQTWRVQGGDETVRLKWSQEESLELVLLDTSRAPIDAASVLVSHDIWGKFTLIADASGLARIPDPERVSEITATKAGIGLVDLQNVYFERGKEVRRSGRLELVADEVGSLSIRVQDLDGDPLPGLQLNLMDQGAFERFRQNPELEGALPTAHPAWSRCYPRTPDGVTGANGVAKVGGILAGTFRVYVDPAAARAPGLSPYSIGRGDFTIGPPWDDLVLTVPAPLFVHLRAHDAATGRPITPLSLHSTGQVGGYSPQTKASTWLGWLNPEEGPFRVTVPGYEALELTAEELTAEPNRELAFWPSGGATLDIEATPEVLANLEGKRLKIVALRPVSPERPWFKRGIWSGEAIIHDGKAHLPLAFEGAYTLKPIELGGEPLHFAPTDFTWQGEARIQVGLSSAEL